MNKALLPAISTCCLWYKEYRHTKSVEDTEMNVSCVKKKEKYDEHHHEHYVRQDTQHHNARFK